MTSVIALAWALEPSAESLPAGQARPEAFALLPGSTPPGCSLVLVGSEPQAARLRVASAARAASPVAYRTGRGVARGLMRRVVMWGPFKQKGGFPPVGPPAPPRARAGPGRAGESPHPPARHT